MAGPQLVIIVWIQSPVVGLVALQRGPGKRHQCPLICPVYPDPSSSCSEPPSPCTQILPLVFVVVVVVLLIIYKAATRPVMPEADPEELLRSLKDTVTPGAP